MPTSATIVEDVQCAAPNVDPEWWTHEHLGPCAKSCIHNLAAHICLTHCAFVSRCQEALVEAPGDLYGGMVLGGLLKTAGRTAHPQFTVPRHVRSRCELC